MPPEFTTILSEQLKDKSGFHTIEAEDGLIVVPGNVYIAPGNYHMVFEEKLHEIVIRLNQDEPEHFCRPSVNPMLRNLANIYKQDLLVIILTGMGADGREGVVAVSEKGGKIIAQDKETSVVWGMPKAAVEQGVCNKVLSLNEIKNLLKNLIG